MAASFFRLIDQNGSGRTIRITKTSSVNEKLMAGKTLDLRTGKIFDGILKTIDIGSRHAEKKVTLNLVQRFLDSWVIRNDQYFGFNNYLGAVNHAYMAEVILRGKRQSKKYRVSSKAAGPWGKSQEIDVERRTNSRKKHSTTRRIVYMLKKKRHEIILDWKRKYIHQLHKKGSVNTSSWRSTKEFDVPKYIEDNRYKRAKRRRNTYQGLLLNARGRRLSAKKAWKVRDGYDYKFYRNKKARNFGTGLYPYVKRGWGDTVTSYNNRNAPRSAYRNIRKGEEEDYKGARLSKNKAYRYKKKADERGRESWRNERTAKYSGYRLRTKGTAIIIYNAAPFAKRLDSLGYDVIPEQARRKGAIGNMARIYEKSFEKELSTYLRHKRKL